jgi:hypothetical protein
LKVTGARYEIAVDGKPRSCRTLRRRIESVPNPNVKLTVRDLETGETIVIKRRPPL